MSTKPMLEAGRNLFKLKARKAKLEEELKATNIQLDEAQFKLAEAMNEAECPTFKIKGLGTVYVQDKVYVNVLADNRPALYQHLRDTGNGSLIVDWVFPQTLTAFVKELGKENKPLPPMVEVKVTPIAATRRGK